MEGKPLHVEKAGPLSVTLLTMGVLASMTSVIDIKGDMQIIGSWAYYTIVAGLGMLIVGALWAYGHTKRIAEFEDLVVERSKANFMKKQDELEYLAWQLPMSYETRLNEKKKEFRIK